MGKKPSGQRAAKAFAGNKYLAQVLNIAFILSMGIFTFRVSIAFSPLELAVGIAISLAMGAVLAWKYDIVRKAFASLTVPVAAAAIVVCCAVISEIYTKFWRTAAGSAYRPFFDAHIWLNWLSYACIAFFLIVVLCVVFDHIFKFMQRFFQALDKADRRVWLVLSILITGIIALLYSITDGFGYSMDQVYSIDSGLVGGYFFPDLYFFDIKHTFLAIASFPMTIIPKAFALIFNAPYLYGVVLAIINGNLLLFIAMLIRKAAGWHTFILFAASSPFWLFAAFFEKYVLVILPLVLLVYFMVENNDKGKIASAAMSVGMISTSGVVFPALFINKKLKDGLAMVVKSVAWAIGLLSVMGRTSVLFHFTEMVGSNMNYTDPGMNIMNKLFSCFDLLASSLFVLPFNITGSGTIWWKTVSIEMNWAGLAVLAVCIIGFIANRRKTEFIFFLYWLIFMFVLFVVIAWSPFLSPLFALYFSWAIIPLFTAGLRRVAGEKHLSKVVYPLAAACFALSIYHLISITNFFVTNPVMYVS